MIFIVGLIAALVCIYCVYFGQFSLSSPPPDEERGEGTEMMII